MQIFEYRDYRNFLRDWLKIQKRTIASELTFAQIAEDIGMQRPAFSKVINGDTDFTADQVFLLSKRLQLKEEETRFFELLVEYDRSGLEIRRKALEEKILLLQKTHISTPQTLSTKDSIFKTEEARVTYFASPWTPLIHVFLTIPKYQSDLGLLRKEIDLPEAEFQRHLSVLLSMELIKKIEGPSERWAAIEKSIHSKELSTLSLAQQLLLRSVSLHKLSVTPLSQRYGLSVSFSADEKCFEEARQVLVRAVSEIHQLVEQSNPQKVYQLSTDLFPWETQDRK